MAPELSRTLLRSSWWAIILGLVFEGLQLAAAAAAGAATPVAGSLLADTAQKVSWSYIVCVALACGTAATRGGPAAIGLLGALAAPLAFGVARAAHKSVAQALAAAAPAGGPSPWLLAGVKAAEYAVFGYLVTRLVRRPELRLPAYVRMGLVIGAVFGALLLWIMDRAAPQGLSVPVLVSRGINELLFPVGCACVLWATGILARGRT